MCRECLNEETFCPDNSNDENQGLHAAGFVLVIVGGLYSALIYIVRNILH